MQGLLTIGLTRIRNSRRWRRHLHHLTQEVIRTLGARPGPRSLKRTSTTRISGAPREHQQTRSANHYSHQHCQRRSPVSSAQNAFAAHRVPLVNWALSHTEVILSNLRTILIVFNEQGALSQLLRRESSYGDPSKVLRVDQQGSTRRSEPAC